jgi:hypothetical protein
MTRQEDSRWRVRRGPADAGSRQQSRADRHPCPGSSGGVGSGIHRSPVALGPGWRRRPESGAATRRRRDRRRCLRSGRRLARGLSGGVACPGTPGRVGPGAGVPSVHRDPHRRLDAGRAGGRGGRPAGAGDRPAAMGRRSADRPGHPGGTTGRSGRRRRPGRRGRTADPAHGQQLDADPPAACTGSDRPRPGASRRRLRPAPTRVRPGRSGLPPLCSRLGDRGAGRGRSPQRPPGRGPKGPGGGGAAGGPDPVAVVARGPGGTPVHCWPTTKTPSHSSRLPSAPT